MNLLKQYLTRNDCYREGAVLAPVGIMVHSTGADNPNLSRYVPGDDYIGRNANENHWDQSNAEYAARFGKTLDKCVHAFIGKTANGSIATVQTLPWDMRGWHAGKRAGNDGYIGFEICEDGLDDGDYFHAVYLEAVELCAMLCREFGLDPLADGVIISHAEGFRRGVASNHADVDHWFTRFGVTMQDFRWAVAVTMDNQARPLPPERFDTMAQVETFLPWAAPTLRRMIDNGDIVGSGKKDENGDPADMDLSRDMIRILVMLYK